MKVSVSDSNVYQTEKSREKKKKKKNIPYMKLRQHLRLVINICKANLLFKNNFKALI